MKCREIVKSAVRCFLKYLETFFFKRSAKNFGVVRTNIFNLILFIRMNILPQNENLHAFLKMKEFF